MSGEILFLAHRVPYPPNRGDKIRSWNILKRLSQIAPVHVCALWDDERDLAHLDVLKNVSQSVTIEPAMRSKLRAVSKAVLSGRSASVEACASPALAGSIKSLLSLRPIKTIFAFSGQMAQFVPAGLADCRFVMDFVDMDSAKFAAFADQAAGPKAWANHWEAQRLFAFEQAVAHRADVSLFVSEAEAALFRSKTGLDEQKVKPLENGIDLDHFRPGLSGQAVLADPGALVVFTGQMDYAPNVEAVEWFVRLVMPHLPGVQFAIVGRAPTARVRALAQNANVIVTGEVADTRDWLSSADVVVAPLRLARGVQNKVLEAMAMGKAVVVTPSAAEGIDAEPGTELIIAETAEAQAVAILELINNPSRAHSIGQAARAKMEARYSWEARLAGLPELVGMSCR